MRYEQLRAEAESACSAASVAAPGSAPIAGSETAPGAATGIYPWECRVALRNSGRVDPRSIDDCIAHCGGYSGLARVLESGPDGAMAELERTGLRGRGGAGYPTAQKWRVCRDAEGDEKHAICNAIDADPRARRARLLLGTDPHAVLEGLLIGAFVVGAAQGYVCINAEYADEIAIVREALEQMRRRGLLGDDILGSGYSCDISVAEIPGSLVSGEETALIHALEGRQPLPYLRFEYPAVEGLRGRPTLVNDVETLANVSAVFQGYQAPDACSGGADAGRPGGWPVSRGTKIVTVCGDASREVTVEAPLGMTVAALVDAVEGAALNALDIKAVQFGGPTGAFFGDDSLAVPIDYEALEAAGSTMGSGTLRVIGGAGHVCAVEMARDAMSYLQEQSCGKCTACREGTFQLTEMLDDLVEGRSRPDDMDLMLELCEAMRAGSICGLGKSAPAPLLSSLGQFADDFDAHVDGKRCPAKE